MNKRLVYIASVYCCVLFQAYSMELVLKKQKDIPFFPLVRNKKKPSMRDVIVKNNNAHEDLLCNVALLPEELREEIALKMFNNNIVAAESFLKTPFIYAMTFYHQDKSLLENGFFVKEMPLDRFFCLSAAHKKNIVEIISSKHPINFFYKNCVLTQEQIEQMRLLDSQVLDEFFSGQEVIVLEPETTWKKYSYGIPCGCAGIGFVSTAIVSTAACLAGHCSKFIFVVGGITVASSCILGVVGAGVLYAHVIKKNIRREVI